MRKLLARIGARAMERLGIVIDDVEVVHRPGVIVVLGRVNERRFIQPNPGESQ